MEPHHHQHEHHHHEPAPTPDWSTAPTPDWTPSPEPFGAPVGATPSDWPSAPDTGWAGSPDTASPDTASPDTASPDTGYPGGGWTGTADGQVAPAARWLPDQPVGWAVPTPPVERPRVSAGRGTAALVCAVASVLVGFCDFGILAVAAIVLGATHRRRVGLGGPGRRRALAGIIIGAIVVLPSLVLSIGFFLPQK